MKFLNPITWLKIIRFHTLLERKGSISKILDYYASVILRFIFKSHILIKILNKLRKSIDIEKIDQFWIIRIGFIKRRNFLPFINVDPNLSNLIDAFFSKMPFICSKIEKIPIGKESCQMIVVKHFFEYLSNKNYQKVIKNWYSILIPGGILRFQIKTKNFENKVNNLKNWLNLSQFFIKEIEEINFLKEEVITLTAIKQKKVEQTPKNIPIEKSNEIVNILEQNKDIFSEKSRICILGYNSKRVSDFLKTLNIGEIYSYGSLDLVSNVSDHFFDCLVVQNFFEYHNYSSNNLIFTELRRIGKLKAEILTIVPEKRFFISKATAQLFEKGIFLKLIDEFNFNLEWISLSSSFKMIQILIKNQNSFPIESNNIKIVLLGSYSLRYSYLINARWDAQARAFEKLGYDIFILDDKDNSFPYILQCIKEFNPEFLWTGGKVVLEFLKKYQHFFRNSKIKVIYWYWDIIKNPPIKFNFKNIIDYMFVTTKSEIPIYRKKYNIDKIFWMPASIIPEIIYQNKFIKKKYDIGFAGGLDITTHRERTQLIEFLKQHFNVKIFQNIYNNLSEYYSKCKIIFGDSPDHKDLELYTSNRFYVGMSCNCCLITNHFKGIERLVENYKHLLWYNNKSDLMELLKIYLPNNELRDRIGRNGRKLVVKNHNYIIRTQNMLDIIKGKTERFYGFIK